VVSSRFLPTGRAGGAPVTHRPASVGVFAPGIVPPTNRVRRRPRPYGPAHVVTDCATRASSAVRAPSTRCRAPLAPVLPPFRSLHGCPVHPRAPARRARPARPPGGAARHGTPRPGAGPGARRAGADGHAAARRADGARQPRRRHGAVVPGDGGPHGLGGRGAAHPADALVLPARGRDRDAAGRGRRDRAPAGARQPRDPRPRRARVPGRAADERRRARARGALRHGRGASALDDDRHGGADGPRGRRRRRAAPAHARPALPARRGGHAGGPLLARLRHGHVERYGAVEALYGRPADQLAATSDDWLGCVVAEDRPRVAASWQAALARGSGRCSASTGCSTPTAPSSSSRTARGS
jgi:hypothetical protein